MPALTNFPCYAKVAKIVWIDAEFPVMAAVNMVERFVGTSSTESKGISIAFSIFDGQAISGQDLERDLTLMRACSAFFADIRAHVSVPHCQAYVWHGTGLGGRDWSAHRSGG